MGATCLLRLLTLLDLLYLRCTTILRSKSLLATCLRLVLGVHCACYYIALPPLDPNTMLLVGVQAVHFSSYCAPLPPSCKASALRCSPEEEEQ